MPDIRGITIARITFGFCAVTRITADKSGGGMKDRASARIVTIDFAGRKSSFAIQAPGRRHTMTQQQHDLLESVYAKAAYNDAAGGKVTLTLSVPECEELLAVIDAELESNVIEEELVGGKQSGRPHGRLMPRVGHNADQQSTGELQ